MAGTRKDVIQEAARATERARYTTRMSATQGTNDLMRDFLGVVSSGLTTDPDFLAQLYPIEIDFLPSRADAIAYGVRVASALSEFQIAQAEIENVVMDFDSGNITADQAVSALKAI